MYQATGFIARYEAELKYRYRVHLEVDTRSDFFVCDMARYIVLARDLFNQFAPVNMAKKRRLKRVEQDTIWPKWFAFVFLFFFCGAFTRLYIIAKKFRVLQIKGIHAK